MEMDDEEKAEAEKKTEDFRKLQEELQAAKPKGTVRAGPPQIERSNINICINILVFTSLSTEWCLQTARDSYITFIIRSNEVTHMENSAD